MATLEERHSLEDALEAVKGSQVWDLPTGGWLNGYVCPLCDTTLLADLTFDEIEQLKTWTVAQLIAWHNLQKRSGIDTHELLAQTSVQDRPGIGALVEPTVLGLTLDGIFIGIEPDGYTHS